VNTQLLPGIVFEHAPPQYLSCMDIVSGLESAFHNQDDAFEAFYERASNCRGNRFSPVIGKCLTYIGLRYGNLVHDHESKSTYFIGLNRIVRVDGFCR